MPWNDNGGGKGGGSKGGGPWKPTNPGPWGQGPSINRQPELPEWLRRLQERFSLMSPGGGLGAAGILIVFVLAIGLWLLSGFYTVGPNQVGLNLIFGAYTGKTSPGLNYNWPYPVGSVERLDVTDQNATDIGFRTQAATTVRDAIVQVDVPDESLMLTGDENIADVKFVVFWQIDPASPESYAFNVSDPKSTVKAVGESAMREIVGQSKIQQILTAGRTTIEPKVKDLMQQILTSYHAGVLVQRVQLQSTNPPAQVIAAFNNVTAAQQDQDRLQNEAKADANNKVPVAGGQASAIVQAAEGQRLQTVAEAKGQAARFDQVYATYKTAPAVTRERMYIETMQKIFGHSDNVIIDDPAAKGGVVPYLPLPQLNKSGASQ